MTTEEVKQNEAMVEEAVVDEQVAMRYVFLETDGLTVNVKAITMTPLEAMKACEQLLAHLQKMQNAAAAKPVPPQPDPTTEPEQQEPAEGPE